MPPRSRSASSKGHPEQDESGHNTGGWEGDEDPQNVRSIDSGPVNLNLDERKARTLPDYRLTFDGQTWIVRQPDVGTVMKVEQVPTSEAFCQLMFEDQWDELGPLLKAYPDARVITEIAENISAHFELDQNRGAPANRRERRAAPRRG